MSALGAIAFATEELAPFGPGGIGKLTQLLVRQALAEGATGVHLFVPATLGVTGARVGDLFGPRVTVSQFEAGDGSALSTSLSLAAHVATWCERSPALDWIEFPDFRGLGFATLHRARALGLRHEPKIRVRVHGPNSLVSWHEQLPIDAERAAQFDLERSCLLLADEVLAPMEPVRDAVATFFRLGGDWRARVRIALPPRLGDVAPRGASDRRGDDLIFPTKAQGIKRPDLFVAAAAEVMQRRPSWRGRAVLAAHRNPAVEEGLFDGLPRPLARRFAWEQWSDLERTEHFQGQVIVVPSDFETLSLAAWEAAAAGARVVASTRCPAFAPGSPWAQWPGFHGFDGTVEGLVQALEQALDAPAPPPFEVPSAPVASPEVPPAAEPATRVTPTDITVLEGGRARWLRALPAVTTAHVLLVERADELGDLAGFLAQAATAVSRGASLVVAAGRDLPTLTQGWVEPGRAGLPLVAPTDLARRVLSPASGRRALLATASQLGYEPVSLFVDARAGEDGATETFPPLFLDTHPFALRAARDAAPPLRRQVIDRARGKLVGALARPLRLLRRR